jgi:DNA-binding response OmpR family regulator
MANTSSKFTDRQVIVVVEDDDDIRHALQDWLHTLAHHQGSFYSQAAALLEALEPIADGWCLRGSGPLSGAPITAAVLDLNLPGMSGFELARQLRAHAPSLPVVVITAASTDTQIQHGGAPPGVHCLKKPFGLDELESKLFSWGAAKIG